MIRDNGSSEAGDPRALAGVWPGLSYSLYDLVTANLFRDALRGRLDCFIASLERPFDYRAKAVQDFNEWIRFDVPAYTGHAEIADLLDLPLMSKPQIRQAPEQFRSSHDLRGTYLKQTTGSTGPPQTFAYSSCFHHETVLLAVPKIAQRLGLAPDPDHRIYSLTIRDKPAAQPVVRFDTTGCGGPGVRVGVDTASPESVLRALEAAAVVRPFCISSSPSVLAVIAEVVSPDLARRVGVKLIVSGGAALPAETRACLESMFQTTLASAYGLSEFGVVASECADERLHFNTSDCYPEIVPVPDHLGRSSGWSAPGGPRGQGEIVITSTTNRTMPFLRYRTGDIGALSGLPCPCGEPSPVLEALIGRVTPAFRMPSGTLFSPTQFRDTFEWFPWLKEFQVIQERTDRVRVLIETVDGVPVSADVERRLHSHFAGRLEEGIEILLEAHAFRRDFKFQRYKSLVDQK